MDSRELSKRVRKGLLDVLHGSKAKQLRLGYQRLNFNGNWLEKAEFLPENYVSVTVMDKLLGIRLTVAIDTDDYK